MRVYLHINYFEQGYDLVTAFKLAREFGVDGIEFRRVPLGSHKKDETNYLDVLASALDRYPVPEISFGAPGPNLTLSDSGQRRAQLESASSFYAQAARRLPVRVINLLLGELINPDQSVPITRFSFQGSVLANADQWEWTVAGCQELADVARDNGLQFAFETHGIYLHDTVESARRLVDLVDRKEVMGILWDRGNELLFDEVPAMAASLKACYPSLFYVHLKNILRYPPGGYRICSLSEGEVDVRQQIRLLKEVGYDGPLCIECPRPGDRVEFLREDLKYLKDLLQSEEI